MKLLAKLIRLVFPGITHNSNPHHFPEDFRRLNLDLLEPRVLFSAAPVGAPESSTDDPADRAVVDEGGAVADTVTQEGKVALSVDTVEIIAEAAKERWVGSGISEAQLDALNSVTYAVADLGGSHLAVASGSTITIDDDAAGTGDWFIDATPEDDEEFVSLGGSAALLSPSRGAESARYDLLTAVIHEQGHLLGLEDGDDGVMGARLSPGTRRLPVVGTAGGAVPGSLEGAHFLDGDLDASFGTGGLVTTDFAGGNDEAHAVTTDASGNIIVAGQAFTGSSYDFAIARYTSDGVLDPTFGSGGKVTTDFAGSGELVYSLTTDSAGNIIAGGYADGGVAGGFSNFALARYTASGDLDSTFGTGGIVTTDFGGFHDYGFSVAADSSGNILVGGHAFSGSNYNFAVARYTSSGALDPTFGSGGLVSTDFGGFHEYGYCMTVDASGNILVAGAGYEGAGGGYNFSVLRYTTSGVLDTSFGSGGIASVDIAGSTDSVFSLATDAAGNIVVAGQALNGTDQNVALARFTASGALDASFGAGGVVVTDIGGNNDYGGSVVIDSSGSIVVAGYTNVGPAGYDFSLARYTDDGVLDSTFGTGGIVTTDFSGLDELGYGLTQDASGNFIVVGRADNGSNTDFGIARYTSSGSLITVPTDDWTQLGGDIDGEFPGDISGYAVAFSADGETLAIGALDNDDNGSSSGHVRVFSWSGTAWVQLGTDIDGEASGDRSGQSVALSADGRILAVGAPGNSGNGAASGHVRVFSWNGTAWVQLGADINGEAEFDASGTSVALSADGQTLAIGAQNNDGSFSNAGHVRIFSWEGGAWIQLGADIDGEIVSEVSGSSVDLSADGRTLAVGAPADYSLYNPGHVRIYHWDGVTWTKLGSDLIGVASRDQYGKSVSLSSNGETIAIGAPLSIGDGSTIAGSVRVFSWNGTDWIQLGSDINAEAPVDFFGWSVALSTDGQTLAVGGENNDGAGNNAGHVRVFIWDGGAWIQLGSDLDGEAESDFSGHTVALSSDGRKLAIGAFGNDGNGSDSGHVRVFQIAASVTVAPTPGEVTLDGAGVATVTGLSGADVVTVRSDGNNLIVGTADDSLTAGAGTSGSGNGDVLIPLAGLTRLAINGGDGDDRITFENLDGFSGALFVDGGDGFDFINIGGSVGATISLAPDSSLSLSAEQVRIFRSSLSTTGDGSIDISGTGSGIGLFQGVLLQDSSLSSENGSISLAGQGGGGSAYNEGVRLYNASVTSTSGDIDVSGTGAAGVLSPGIALYNRSSLTAGNGGSITLVGQGGVGTGSNGIEFNSGSSASVVDGDLSLTGTGGSSGSQNRGVDLLQSSLSSFGAGNISLVGFGRGSAIGGDGVGLAYSSITASGSGSISLEGTASGNGTYYNHGIELGNASVLSTASGDISLTGRGGGSLAYNSGLVITNSSVASSAGGNLTLEGFGSTNSTGYGNQGIVLKGSDLGSTSGVITLTGTGGTGTYRNDGIYSLWSSMNGSAVPDGVDEDGSVTS